MKLPVDAPKRKFIRALELLGFKIIREKEHISMLRENPDGSRTPLTMPNHEKIKASILEQSALKQVFREMNSLRLTVKHNKMYRIHTALEIADYE